MSRKRNVTCCVWNFAESRLGKLARRFSDDRVMVYAAQASFYITLSAIPFLMLLVTLIGHLPFIAQDQVIALAITYLPEWLHETAMTLIEEIFERSGIPAISITVASLLWLSSRGFKSIGQGVRNVYHTNDRVGYFRNLLLSLLFTVGFVIFMVIIVATMIFGGALTERMGLTDDVYSLLFRARWIFFFLILTLIFTVSFRFMTRYDASVRAHLPGAAFASLGWILFSALYSFYIEHFTSYSYVYGSMAAIVLLVLWVYYCMLILMAGAELNMLLFEGRTRNEEKKRKEQDE